MKRLTVNTRHEMLTESTINGDGYRAKALAHNRPVKLSIGQQSRHVNTMRALSKIDLTMPTMVGEDYARLSRGNKGGVMGTLESLSNTGLMGLANMARLESLSNTVDMLGKLNAGVLVGGNRLKTDLLAYAWDLYLHIEIIGTDNAHYTEAHIPCDARNETSNNGSKCKGSFYTDLTAGGKARRSKLSNCPDSSLTPEGQYLALSIERKMTINRD